MWLNVGAKIAPLLGLVKILNTEKQTNKQKQKKN
jgi:hypothetical protein